MHAELRIRQILESPSDLSDKVHVLVDEAKKQTDQPEELVAFLRFFNNAGFYQELLSLLVELLESNKQVPWSLLFEMLGRIPEDLPRSVVQSIEKGIRRQNSQDSVWPTLALDEYFPEFVDWRVSLAESFKNIDAERKNELLEKFHFLSNQRLENEARQVLRVLKSSYPEDSKIDELQSHFEEHHAREILSDYSASFKESADQVYALAPEEKNFLSHLKTSSLEVIKSKPELTADLSLFFFFLEDYDSALEIIQSLETPNFSEIWLKAEFLRYSRRFVEALAIADEIAEVHKDHADTLIATIYFRAEVFGDMGKFSRAIELLENIAHIRPQYRSTSYLIQQFKSRGLP